MFIELSIQKKKEYWLLSLFASILFALVGLISGVEMWPACCIGLLMLVVLTLRIHFDPEKTPSFVGPVIGFIFSFLIFCEVQLAVGTTLAQITMLKLFLNVLVVYALVLFIASAGGNLSYALIGVQAVLILLGIANNLVVQTRGMEIQFADILSISTAATVAGDYTYTLTARSVMAIMLTVVQIFFFTFNRLPKFKKMPLRITGLSTGTVSLILVIALVSTSGGAAAIGFQLKSWKLQPSSYNGFLINLLHSVSATRVNAPDGYSRDELDQLINQYYPKPEKPSTGDDPLVPDTNEPDIPDTNEPSEPEKKPNIIVIMNETFSDLTTLADSLLKEMNCDTEVLPFFHSLSNDAPNIVKGHAMASVFGGNTANSEFEFLTGNTMAFLPANTVAYNLYLNETNAFSVVDIMEAEGYRTIGMHPEVSTNWKRNLIYQYYGFDETYFLETDKNGLKSFVNGKGLTEDELYRGHVSDSTIYNRIIDLYENKDEGESLFTFAITMQNHGGYNSSGFDYTVNMSSDGSSKSVNEYLSSVNNSDAALQELLAYFEAQEEETLIVLFGDHQPSLPVSFYNDCLNVPDDSPLELLQAKYVVPYLFWGNYDFETQFNQITSINYLSSHMLEVAGLEKTRFMELMDMIEHDIPAINSFGWWDSDLRFHSFQAEDSNEVNHLRLYQFLQYNRLFDLPEDKLTDWFLPSSVIRAEVASIPRAEVGKEDEE